MKFIFTDAWLLNSIYHSEIHEHGSELVDIIAYADYTNHAIMTYKEFTNSLNKLLHIGLVIQFDKKLITTNIFKTWFTEKYKKSKRLYVLKMIEESEKYLNNTFEKTELPENNIDIEISSDDFTRAIEEYIGKYSLK